MTRKEAKAAFGMMVRSKTRLIKRSYDSEEHRVEGLRVWDHETCLVEGLLIGTRTLQDGRFYCEYAGPEDYVVYERTNSFEAALIVPSPRSKPVSVLLSDCELGEK